jgi:FlaA1/EpsC-like NDP-sugar epimerase
MISTDKAVNPSNVMEQTHSREVCAIFIVKTDNESVVLLNFTTRFGNVLGSNGSVVPLFTKQIARRTYHDNPS